MKTYEITVSRKMTYRTYTVTRIVTVENVEEEIKNCFRGVDAYLKSALCGFGAGIGKNVSINYKQL